jgi:NDP-sugar pyrophosphorylase family protein
VKPQLIVPMTGISSRFTAAGYDRPKFLLEVDGQTVVEHVIDMYPGWDDVIFVCNEIHLDDPRWDLEALLLSKRPNARIVRCANNTKGPGWAVLQAKDLVDLDRAVVVNYCDFTCYWDADDFAAHLTSGEVEGSIPVYTGFHPHMAFSTSYAYPKLENGWAVDIQEKQPWTDDPSTEYASSGTYGFASGRILFEAIDAQMEQGLTLKDEYYLSLTYKPMMQRGAKVSVYNLQHFMQWGTPQDFEEYRDNSRAIAGWTGERAGQGHGGSIAGVSRVVLASGAGSRFAKEGYTLPKPALPLSGRSLVEHALDSLPGSHSVVVTRSDLSDDGTVLRVAEQYDADVVTLPGLSRGQAESALFGLEAVADDDAVTVTACDAISVVDTATVQRLFEEVGPDGLVVWLAAPYHLAARRPEQYGWAVFDDDGAIESTFIKKSPDQAGAGVIVGTFGFGSARGAREMIESLIADDETVNGEYYLDSLVARAIAQGRTVRALRIPSFVSVGTPTEYESVRYWQSCFHKWPLHPYSLPADPMVPSADRMDLDRAFRAWDPVVAGAPAT